MNLARVSRERLAEHLRAELATHFEAQAAGQFRRFWLQGVDPFDYEAPSQVISALYWSWEPSTRRRLTSALLALAGERALRLPPEAVEELLLAVALMQEAKALLPMVRILNARRDLGSARHGAFVTAIQVARGFGPVPVAWQTIDALSGFGAFPVVLVFDAFEANLSDPGRRWETWFEDLERKMIEACRIGRIPQVRVRLQAVAAEMARVLSDVDIERGLRRLLPMPPSAEAALQWSEVLQPREMLAAALCTEPASPFAVVDRPHGVRVERLSAPRRVRPAARVMTSPLPAAIGAVDVEEVSNTAGAEALDDVFA